MIASQPITELLRRVGNGDDSALHDVVPLVYDELKRLAASHLRREYHSGAINPTMLVHEAYLRLANGKHPCYQSRSHFYGITSRLMRQILVDTARARCAQKRNNAEEIPLADLPDWAPRPDKSVLAIDEALKRLERVHPLMAKVVEMQYFGGMTAEESADALGKPVHVIRRELRLARAWLHREITQ